MPSASSATSVQSLNGMPLAEFTAVLADIFEHSPWVAERAGIQRPFQNLPQLHQAMVNVVEQAGASEKMALLRAHPQLAGQEAQQGSLTAASDLEQARAGLKALSPEEMKRITGLNAAYLDRHGFPFIVCVGKHTKHSLFLEFDRRLGNPSDAEMREALGQVAAIAQLRLDALLAN